MRRPGPVPPECGRAGRKKPGARPGRDRRPKRREGGGSAAGNDSFARPGRGACRTSTRQRASRGRPAVELAGADGPSGSAPEAAPEPGRCRQGDSSTGAARHLVAPPPGRTRARGPGRRPASGPSETIAGREARAFPLPAGLVRASPATCMAIYPMPYPARTAVVPAQRPSSAPATIPLRPAAAPKEGRRDGPSSIRPAAPACPPAPDARRAARAPARPAPASFRRRPGAAKPRRAPRLRARSRGRFAPGVQVAARGEAGRFQA